LNKLRLAAVLAVAALPASAGVAHAAKPKAGTFTAPKGQVQLGYDLKFQVDAGGTRISNLVAHVLERCSGSSTSTVTTVGPDLTWKISKSGRFNGRLKETEGDLTLYTTLRGRFTSPTTAKGILRQESIVAGATCDTHELKFTAKRG
jgi:hypothetical protein